MSQARRHRDEAFGQGAIDDARLCSGRGHQISKGGFRRIALAIYHGKGRRAGSALAEAEVMGIVCEVGARESDDEHHVLAKRVV